MYDYASIFSELFRENDNDPGVWDRRRVSEIDWSHTTHETTLWWRHKQPVPSQSNDLIKLPIYP